MSDELLKIEQVTMRYDSLDGVEAPPVLREVNLTVRQGESVAVVGPSGSGKSTLLNVIGTLDRPTSGRVVLEGRDLSRLDDVELAAVRNRCIGWVFQFHHLLPQCTVLENVLVPTLVSPAEAGEEPVEHRARRLLGRVGLAERLSHRPGQISGGERQRAAVVRALINRPKLLLADEPTGSLDRAASDNLTDLLIDLNREEGVTLIVVTHSMDVARRMGRLIRIADGVVTEEPR